MPRGFRKLKRCHLKWCEEGWKTAFVILYHNVQGNLAKKDKIQSLSVLSPLDGTVHANFASCSELDNTRDYLSQVWKMEWCKYYFFGHL